MHKIQSSDLQIDNNLHTNTLKCIRKLKRPTTAMPSVHPTRHEHREDRRLTMKHSNLCNPTHIYILGTFHHPE